MSDAIRNAAGPAGAPSSTAGAPATTAEPHPSDRALNDDELDAVGGGSNALADLTQCIEGCVQWARRTFGPA